MPRSIATLNKKSIGVLIARRDHLIHSLPPMNRIIRGSLMKYFHEGCRCHPHGRYGPYWYLSVKLGGKTKMRRIPDPHLPVFRKAVQNHDRWEKLSFQIFELNTLIARSGGKEL